jgi:cytochrome c oxidase subunit 2
MKILVIIVIVLAIIAFAQIMKVYSLSNKLRNKDEADITKDETKFNSAMLIIFLLAFMVSSIYLMVVYGARPGLGNAASEHGVEIDWLYDLNWIILLPVFFLTQPLLFIFAAKYSYKEGNKATFFSHSNKLELIWTIIPAATLAVIIIFGLSVWNDITSVKENTKTIEIYAQQFGWTARYAGDDNELGKSDFKVIDESKNPLGILTTGILIEKQKAWEDEIEKLELDLKENGDLTPDVQVAKIKAKVTRLKRQIKRLNPLLEAQTSEDDVKALNDVIVKELVLLKGQEYEFKFRSRDVLHSAFFPHFRAQMNCVPGMVTRLSFKPTITTEEMRNDPVIKANFEIINKKKELTGEDASDFNFVLLCNKICGASHYNMQMNIIVVETKAEYERWFNEQKEKKSFAALTGFVQEVKVELSTEPVVQVINSVEVSN